MSYGTRPQRVNAPPGQRYGMRKAQEDAQKQVPLPDARTPAARAPTSPQGQPIQRPNVFGPTERPSEPITAGTGLLPPDPVAHLRALYLQFPNEDLRRLLERAAERR